MRKAIRLVAMFAGMLSLTTAHAQCYEFATHDRSTVVTMDLSRATLLKASPQTGGIASWRNVTTSLLDGGKLVRRSDGHFVAIPNGISLSASGGAAAWSISLIGRNSIALVNSPPQTLPPPSSWAVTAMLRINNGTPSAPMPVASISACKRLYVFIGGFFDKTMGNAVQKYVRPLIDMPPPNSRVEYLTWDGLPRAEKLLHEAGPSTQVFVIGHSYGGDTAVQLVASCMHHVDVLVTIDPVGGRVDKDAPYPTLRKPPNPPPPVRPPDSARLTALFNGARPCMGYWFDVFANPATLNESDYVARLGGRYGTLPVTPVKFADTLLEADLHHAEFSLMMGYAKPDGRSAESYIFPRK